MTRHNGVSASQRRWWQRYPMFGLAAGWVVIAIVMAGASQLRFA
ncbi:hypothetical protein [Caulobacter sp.]